MPTKHKGSDSCKKTRMDIGGSLQGTRRESFGKGPSLFLKEKIPPRGKFSEQNDFWSFSASLIPIIFYKSREKDKEENYIHS